MQGCLYISSKGALPACAAYACATGQGKTSYWQMPSARWAPRVPRSQLTPGCIQGPLATPGSPRRRACCSRPSMGSRPRGHPHVKPRAPGLGEARPRLPLPARTSRRVLMGRGVVPCACFPRFAFPYPSALLLSVFSGAPFAPSSCSCASNQFVGTSLAPSPNEIAPPPCHVVRTITDSKSMPMW